MKTMRKILAIAIAVTTMAAYTPAAVYAQEAGVSVSSSAEEEVIYVDVENAPIVNIDTSDFEQVYLGASAKAVNLPYSGSILFGGNTTEAYSPVFNTSFPDNTSGFNVGLSNISGTKKVKIAIYTHIQGEGSTIYHQAISSDYSFSTVKTRKFLLGSTTTSVDQIYIVFGGGTTGYATEFDYSVSIS